LHHSKRPLVYWILTTFLLCLACSSRRIAREVGVHISTSYRWCWWLRNAAFTVTTVQKAADIAVRTGSRLYTDSASSYQALKGYAHAFVNHTKKEYARGDVHENRAACLFSLLKPYLRVFRGLSKFNLPGYLGFFQFLRNFRQHNAFEQAELILRAALEPTIARRAKKGEFVKCFDHFDLLQTARN
jgi:hypothetical protein